MNKLIKVLAISALGIMTLFSVFIGANYAGALTEDTKTRSEKAHWSYEGNQAPKYWGELATEYKACAIGIQQSPINIDKKVAINAYLQAIKFDYQKAPLNILNNGHSIQVNYVPGSSITLDDKKYDLVQFHFHHPSEHTINGSAYPMEAHLVHQNPETRDLAVVGILLEIGTENQALKPVWNNMPKKKSVAKTVANTQINAADLLPENTQNYYRYFGSLTTPPCSEIVNWIVMKEPIHVSPKQVKRFTNVVGKNARHVQDRGHRFVLE